MIPIKHERVGRTLMIRPFVEELPSRYRRAVELTSFDDLTQREVASNLGLSLSGTKSSGQRARQMLGTMLAECCGLEFDGRGSLARYELKKGCSECRSGAEKLIVPLTRRSRSFRRGRGRPFDPFAR
jgi:hypothetical protein